MSTTTRNRPARAQEIASVPSNFRRIGRSWFVRSQHPARSSTWYRVTDHSCTCPDFVQNHPSACKHMLALAAFLGRSAPAAPAPAEPPAPAPAPQPEPDRCPNCGATADLVWRSEYVGGHGYRLRLQCRDQVECWHRWDLAHGFTTVA
jgi:hypothetical protein